MMQSFEEKKRYAVLTGYAAHHGTAGDEKDGECCNNQDAAGP